MFARLLEIQLELGYTRAAEPIDELKITRYLKYGCNYSLITLNPRITLPGLVVSSPRDLLVKQKP